MKNDAFLFRLKAAQRDLISRCGGIERCVSITEFSKSQVGRWNSSLDSDLMPIAAVVALEAECGVPYVTAVMAEANGRRLSDPDGGERANVDVMASHADVMRRFGELAHAVAIAFSDGMVTPTEAATIDRHASGVVDALSGLRKAAASVKARGGERGGLSVVGD